ncbi:MAG: hypothetical protein AABX07_02630 [Nanoarchaeota archaeon]
MKSNKILVSLVAALVLALFLISNVSASVDITSVKLNEVEVLSQGAADLSSFAGQVVPVKIVFHADSSSSDVRIKAWLSGSSGSSTSSERFDLISERDYVRFLSLQMPSNIDLNENIQLVITVESRNEGILGAETIDLSVQRESYTVEILDVSMDSKAVAGDNLAVDIVLKNRGMHLAEDTFVKVKIPLLGVEEKSYFGDLSPVDQVDPNKEDAAERRMSLRVPSNAKPGVYTVEIEAYNADSTTTLSKKIAIVGASDESSVVSPTKSKTIAAGGSAEYSLTLVNSGSKVKIYEVVVEAPAGLTVDVDEPVVAIPAGTSKTVKLKASASKVGVYDFTASVQSSGDLVKKESFVANVEGSRVSAPIAGNTTVLLTIVLAIIFVVLLVVLIVLLTRKPEKTKEFGESYY